MLGKVRLLLFCLFAVLVFALAASSIDSSKGIYAGNSFPVIEPVKICVRPRENRFSLRKELLATKTCIFRLVAKL